MGITFFGGPYDGREVDYKAINQYASILPVIGDLEVRVFVLMPPLESWDKLLRSEVAETSPKYPYEQVITQEGPRFEWRPSSGLDQALLEARLKVHPRAKTALSTLSDELGRAIVAIVAELQKSPPDSWPAQKANRLNEDKSIYLVQLPSAMRAFVRVLDTGGVELVDLVREDTLRLFRERYATASGAA